LEINAAALGHARALLDPAAVIGYYKIMSRFKTAIEPGFTG
jgi:hypothetical protein